VKLVVLNLIESNRFLFLANRPSLLLADPIHLIIKEYFTYYTLSMTSLSTYHKGGVVDCLFIFCCVDTVG